MGEQYKTIPTNEINLHWARARKLADLAARKLQLDSQIKELQRDRDRTVDELLASVADAIGADTVPSEQLVVKDKLGNYYGVTPYWRKTGVDKARFTEEQPGAADLANRVDEAHTELKKQVDKLKDEFYNSNRWLAEAEAKVAEVSEQYATKAMLVRISAK